MQKKLPIGVEYFKSFKYDNFYYVDKTGFEQNRCAMAVVLL